MREAREAREVEELEEEQSWHQISAGSRLSLITSDTANASLVANLFGTHLSAKNFFLLWHSLSWLDKLHSSTLDSSLVFAWPKSGLKRRARLVVSCGGERA